MAADPTSSDHLVRTRFAPSPTGYLHIGGARTALFNYLLARRLGGRFVLRIEDTDRARNIPGAEQKLLDDLRWLGLQWDEGPEVGGEHGPYRQSERLELYREQAQRLLDAGQAYYAFDTREELEAMRAEARRRKQNFRYPRPRSFPSEADARRARDEGRPVVVRFCMPQRDFVVADRILGNVHVRAGELDDFVILKDDGWPTYHFAVVVDDEHMQITHVLRGQEHLINTPRHMALQQALGFRTPIYAHLPIILNMDGSKMSKREKFLAVQKAYRRLAQAEANGDDHAAQRRRQADEATGASLAEADARDLDPASLERVARVLGVEPPEIEVHDFRRSGYLPEVIVNFIALLGWSPGDDRERMTLDELCQAFSLERIGKTSARFDRSKLLAFNTDALRDATVQRRLAAFRDYLDHNPGSPLRGLDDAMLQRLMDLCAGFRIFRDIDVKCGAIFQPDEQVRYNDTAVRKVLLRGDGAGLDVVREMRARLEALDAWTAGAIERVIRGFAKERGLGLGRVAQPLRVAAVGTMVSPPIFDTLELLGRERTLRRIGTALDRFGPLRKE